MRLWDRGGIDLDRPLAQQAPGRYPSDKAALTPRLLLAHAAGLPPHVPFQHQLPPAASDPDRVREEVLAQVRQVPLAGPPGISTVYSDLGMILLGDLLEALLGMPLDQAFETEIAAPLGLRHTFYVHLTRPAARAVRPPEAFAATEACTWRGRVVRGQVHDENAFLLQGVAGHAGLFSTAREVAVLANEILAALAGGRALLSQRAAAEMATPQVIGGECSRALGWGRNGPDASCGSRFSARALGHTGFTGTSVWLDPERDRYVVLLANRVHPSRDNDRFLDLRPTLHDLAVDELERRGGN
jgi:CubicO group peptidase (beta-lactamase class C family)